jgi:hypothetical protein
MASLRQLPPTQPGDDTRPLPPTQHPQPLQQATRLQVLLLQAGGSSRASPADLNHPSGERPADQPSEVRVRRRRHGVPGPQGGPHGVWLLQGHVQAISEFPPPQDVKQLKQFLGMVNFYRRFLPGIACTLQLLTDALRGAPKTLQWLPAAAFGAAKAALVAAVPYRWRTPPRTLCSPSQQTPPTYTWGACFNSSTGELAAAGILLQEAVGGGHQVLHLRQKAAGRLQRGQTLQIPAGRATVSLTHSPQATGHILVPHHTALVGPPTETVVLHRRV